ncbi:hypothetical protein ACFVT1_06340 [Streptomyces sp. NPDC057963]|uniref:hypothetical protein n=1 Tax=Streptomyces sp. NPDC057963 TaxID=3346290 RepID=UPI0036E9B423
MPLGGTARADRHGGTARPAGPPLVVAWIEGRPYWPQDVYTDIDPSDPRALDALSNLVPGPV